MIVVPSPGVDLSSGSLDGHLVAPVVSGVGGLVARVGIPGCHLSFDSFASRSIGLGRNVSVLGRRSFPRG